MSDYEHHIGKITEVVIKESLELTCKEIVENNELPSYQDSYVEYLLDELYDEYLVINGKLYSVEKEAIDPYDDIQRLHKNEDGTFSFEAKFYNGGTCLSEVLEDAFNKISDKE